MGDIYVDLRTQNKWIQEAFENQDMASIEDLLTKIEDLLDDYADLELEYEQFKSDVQDNYIRVPLAEQLDISDKDFI